MTENSSTKPRLGAAASLHPNQLATAAALGLDEAMFASVEAAVDAIEAKLGKAAFEERARWFAVSVLRHLRKAKWAGPQESGLDEARQRELAKDCLAVDGFSTSLGTVTKDARSRFRLVGFASSKKIERGVLATSTKAYKIAAHVIAEAGLVEEQAAQATEKTTPVPKAQAARPEVKEAGNTVVGRRAKRRGYFEDELMQVADAAEATTGSKQAASMSKEEFANLDAALSMSDAEIVQQKWGDQEGEDRWSRILGLLAGIGFFVFVALLFL